MPLTFYFILFYFYLVRFHPDPFSLNRTRDGSGCLNSVLHTLHGLSLELLDLPKAAQRKSKKNLQ